MAVALEKSGECALAWSRFRGTINCSVICAFTRVKSKPRPADRSNGQPAGVVERDRIRSPATVFRTTQPGGVMAPRESTHLRSLSVRPWLGVAVLAAFLAVTPLSANDGDKSSPKPPAGKAPRDAGVVEGRF